MADSLAEILQTLNIKFEPFSHPPVFTCEQANQYLKDIPGIRTKNLFLTTKTRSRFYLITASEAGQVDLKALAQVFDSGKLSFANSEDLQQVLGIAPGCVSLLALTNDNDKQVKVYVDSELWGEMPLHCHPLVNSETLLIAPKELERLFIHTGHSINLIKIPKV